MFPSAVYWGSHLSISLPMLGIFSLIIGILVFVLHLLKWSCEFCPLFIWYITLIDFWMLKQPCIPEINLSWSWYIILPICGEFTLLILCQGFLSVYSLGTFVFLVCSFGITLVLISYNELIVFFPHLISERVYEE